MGWRTVEGHVPYWIEFLKGRLYLKSSSPCLTFLSTHHSTGQRFKLNFFEVQLRVNDPYLGLIVTTPSLLLVYTVVIRERKGTGSVFRGWAQTEACVRGSSFRGSHTTERRKENQKQKESARKLYPSAPEPLAIPHTQLPLLLYLLCMYSRTISSRVNSRQFQVIDPFRPGAIL